MATPPEKLAALRHLLAERFPAAVRPATSVLATGIHAIDEAAGGIPLSAITESMCAAPSCGSQLLFGQLLAAARAARIRVALIDSTDCFDPASFAEDLLAPLVWVRCAGTTQALAAADLLTRDANLGLILLDLRRAPLAELRRTPATQWYRLQRTVEPTDLALVVETPRAMVPSAQLRFALTMSHPADALDRERNSAAAELAAVVERQRVTAAG